MGKRLIITLVYEGEEYDFEMPSQTPVRDLEEKLESLLPNVFKGLFLEDKVFYLATQSGYLSPDFSLEDQGIYDGARLQIKIIGD